MFVTIHVKHKCVSPIVEHIIKIKNKTENINNRYILNFVFIMEENNLTIKYRSWIRNIIMLIMKIVDRNRQPSTYLYL